MRRSSRPWRRRSSATIVPQCTAAQALYTALEHEAMHQETLLYMWHRLPYEQKRKPAIVVRASGSGAARHPRFPAKSNERVRIPAGTVTLGADRARLPFGWDNEFDEQRVDVPRLRHRRLQRDERGVPRVRRGGRVSRRSLWSDENWTWIQERRDAIPPSGCSGGTHGGSGTGAGCSTTFRCRPIGRCMSVRPRPRVRRVEGATTPDRSGVSPRRVRDPRRVTSASIPWGDASPDRDARQLRFRARWEPVPGWIASGAARVRGASTILSATDGNGRRRSSVRSRASSRWRRTRSTRRIFSTVSTTS